MAWKIIASETRREELNSGYTSRTVQLFRRRLQRAGGPGVRAGQLGQHHWTAVRQGQGDGRRDRQRAGRWCERDANRARLLEQHRFRRLHHERLQTGRCWGNPA